MNNNKTTSHLIIATNFATLQKSMVNTKIIIKQPAAIQEYH